MDAAESHIIVDFEQSFLRYPFATYLPFFYQIAYEESRKCPIAKLFYEQYRDKTLTFQTVYNFLREYEDDLYAELLLNPRSALSATDEKYLSPTTLLEIDGPLKKRIILLYNTFHTPIIIITANPYKQLIRDYLNNTLPKGSFRIVYAPLLSNIEKPVSNIQLFRVTPGIESPPPGYSLIINSTRPEPEEGWQSYAAELEQRLLSTGYFYDLRKEKQQLREQELKEQQLREQQLREQQLKEQQLKEQQLKEQQLKEQELKEQELKEQQLREQEQKKQNEAASTSIQGEWLYPEERSFSPGFFSPAISLSDKNSSVESPTVRRVKRDLPYSPSRPASPFRASPSRPESPAQHIPTTNIFKRFN